jgi:acyl carrier protein phosphodiesterase
MMNYLAHAYLSFKQPGILVGNMISDFVKGKRQYDYERSIQYGIRLHREIDNFTDNHEATKKAKEIFRPHYRLYSGALVDIVYDHFLANDPKVFANDTLKDFTTEVYTILEANTMHLPARFLTLLPYMISENWLYYYKDKAGIQKTFRGLIRRAAFISDHDTAFELFIANYDQFRACYETFFPDVKNFTKRALSMNDL